MEEEEAKIRFVQSSSSDQFNPILIVGQKKIEQKTSIFAFNR
jgi:hypothetical protein